LSKSFVKQGGGLLWIGGERNVYVENQNVEDPIERALPAKLAPPRTPEGTCVVLIIDKSSSMEGKKMELARLASIGVVENLRPIDMSGPHLRQLVPVDGAIAERWTVRRSSGWSPVSHPTAARRSPGALRGLQANPAHQCGLPSTSSC